MPSPHALLLAVLVLFFWPVVPALRLPNATASRRIVLPLARSVWVNATGSL